MCIREVSKCLYQASTVMCMCQRGTVVSVPSQDSDVYVCYRGIEVSVPRQNSDVYVCQGIDCVYVSTILIFDSDSVTCCDCADNVVFVIVLTVWYFVIVLTVWYFGIVLTVCTWYFVFIYHLISMIAAAVV